MTPLHANVGPGTAAPLPARAHRKTNQSCPEFQPPLARNCRAAATYSPTPFAHRSRAISKNVTGSHGGGEAGKASRLIPDP